ncbi:MAG: RsmE family RNA methyltransferase [Clostridia bacterium]
MDIKRFFAPAPIDNIITLEGEEFYHAVKTTRHKVGYLIIVATGDRYDYLARITQIDKDRLTAQVIEKKENNTEPQGQIILLQGLCKEFDFIVRKAVELGATDICPFISERTNIKEVSKERLERIIREAAKQCGRACLPVLHNTVSFNDALAFSYNIANRLLCYEEQGEGSIANAIGEKDKGKNAAIYIGSEGGFTAEEVQQAKDEGITCVSLGKRTLRSETAAIAALTLTMSALGEL